MMNVLFAVSEAVPFVKTGGLADVAGALPRALKQHDIEAAVLLPLYREIPAQLRRDMKKRAVFRVRFGGRSYHCGLFETEHEGVRYYFIDNGFYYARGYLYGYEDEAERFVFFSCAVAEALPLLGFMPDLIHCHDWQTGLIPYILRTRMSHLEAYRHIRTVYTIHNMQYQGCFAVEKLAGWLSMRPEEVRADRLEEGGIGNCMKAGLVYADQLTTVSRTYAQEILTTAYGEGLDAIVRARSADLKGIVNGIDTDVYNPMTDAAAAFTNYGDMVKKMECKAALQRELGLSESPGTPLIGIVSRLVEQKGFDLILTAMDALVLQGEAQFAVLGSGDARYEAMLQRKAADCPEAVFVRLGFDDKLARRIYAGADMYVMPSRFEPCGLSQLIALKYGAVPIVRETGGLKDTIQAYNEYTRRGTGFSFRRYEAGELLHTVRRAISYYRNAEEWQRIVENGARRNVGWHESAREYATLYRGLAVNGKG